MKAKLINTVPKLKKLAKKMMTIDEFAFDTETNTLEWALTVTGAYTPNAMTE